MKSIFIGTCLTFTDSLSQLRAHASKLLNHDFIIFFQYHHLHFHINLVTVKKTLQDFLDGFQNLLF